MRNSFLRLIAVLAFVLGGVTAFGYDLIYKGDDQGQSRRILWNSGSIPFVIRMSQTANLQDGSSYASSVQAAMNAWNGQIVNVQFTSSVAAPGLATDGDGINEIAFDTKIYSNSTDPENPPQDFGENTLAVTLSWTTTTLSGDGTFRRTQSDILFNSKWDWNSYRGGLQQPEDIRRVAIHELGHVLGLDHPDQDGQSVTAIMNAYVSNIDSLQTDDLTGAQLQYGRPGGVSAPGNDNFSNATTISLSSGSTTLTGSSVGATHESGEPHHGSDRDGASIWWKWTAPSNGTLTVNTLGSNFDTLLAIYTGGAVGSLTQIEANDDASDTERRSRIPGNAANPGLTVSSGTTYYIAVDGWDAQWGAVFLNVSFTPAVASVAPTITSDPSSTTIGNGAFGSFSVAATGTAPLAYRWQVQLPSSSTWLSIQDSPNYGGATTATLTVRPDASFDGIKLRCVVSNSVGSATSNPATLTVHTRASIVYAPVSVKLIGSGGTAQFTVTVFGNPTPTLQWQRLSAGGGNWTNLVNDGTYAGVTSTVLTVSSVSFAMNGDRFRCVVTNSLGFDISHEAWLNVGLPPVVEVKPLTQDVPEWARFSLRATLVSGTTPVTYQWYRNGISIPGATDEVYSIYAELGAAGSYTVVVSNIFGSVTSAPASVTVQAAPPTITQQPTPQTVFAKTTATFALTVSSSNTVSYAWQRKAAGASAWNNLSEGGAFTGVATASMSVYPTDALMSGDEFRCVVTNAGGSVTSAAVALTVRPLLGVVGVSSSRRPASVGTGIFLRMDGSLWFAVGGGQAPIAQDVVKVSSGPGGGILYLKPDRTLWGFGFDRYGQLGNGAFTDNASLVQVASDVVAVSAEGGHTLFLKSNGTLWATGSNVAGQLLSGDAVSLSTPVQVAEDVTTMAVAGRATFFVRSDGTLWVMGVLTTTFAQPTMIATGVRAVAGAEGYGLFIKSDGSLWIVGQIAGSGQLFSTPIHLDDDVVSMSAGEEHFVYVKSDGALLGAGSAGSGRLGSRGSVSFVPALQPVQLAANVATAVAHGSTTMFADTDGMLWMLGFYLAPGNLQSVTTTPVAWTSGPLTAPSAVSDFAATVGIADTVRLTWSQVLGADRYEIYRASTSDVEDAQIIATVRGQGIWHDRTAVVGTTYHYWVRPGNGAGFAQFSNATSGSAVAAQLPTISTQPSGKAVAFGASATLSVVATGLPAPSFQWQRYNPDVSAWADVGIDSGHLRTFSPTAVLSERSTGLFRCAVRNSAGTVTSDTVTIEVINGAQAPIMQTQPQTKTVTSGEATSFSVSATGPALTYRWEMSSDGGATWGATPIPLEIATPPAVPSTGSSSQAQFSGGDTPILSIAYSTGLNGRRFRCVVSNFDGQVTSNAVTLTVLPIAPVITTQPQTQFVVANATVSLSVAVTSEVAVTYQWFFNGSAIPGSTAATLTLPAFQIADNGNYWVSVTNSVGTTTSNVALVEIANTPVIDVPPIGATFIVGTSPALSVAYTTNAPPSFLWARNDNAIVPSNAATFGLSNIQQTQAGAYRVVLSNAAGIVSSASATVAVVPQDGVLSAAAGYSHSLFLRTDGRLFGMGRAVDGALPRGAGIDNVWTVPVMLAEDVVQMSAGDYFTVYITRDGKLWGRGSNNCGQLGDGTTTDRLEPFLIATDVAAVDAGGEHTLFIKKDGTVWAMGRNNYGQLGDGTQTNRPSPVQVADNAIAVSAGSDHSLMVKSGGTLWASGYGGGGALGLGNTQSFSTWQQVATNVAAISAGGGHSLFIKSDATLWAMGFNSFFAVGDGTSTDRLTPVQIATSVSLVCAGYGNSLFTKSDGSLWAMGSNFGAFGNGTSVSSSVPLQISVPTAVNAIAVGFYQSLQARADGSLWATGLNSVGQLGIGYRSNDVTSPALVTSGTLSATAAPTDLAASDGTYSDGVRLAWTAPLGWRRFEVWRNTTNNSATATQLVQRVSLPYYFDSTAVLGQTYYYWVKAANPTGVTGFSAADTGFSSLGPPPVIVAPPASQTVTAGSSVTFAVSATGNAPITYQWFKGTTAIAGANTATLTLPYVLAADVGSYSVTVSNAAGSTTSVAATLAISGPAAVVQVATGAYHSLFLRGDGTLWAAGNNTAGQLGDGTTTNRENAVQVATDVCAIYAGWWHSFFLKSDGTLWAMGSNTYGQFGNGTTTSTTQPVQVMSGVLKVATWERRTLFLKSDGTLWVAGNGAMGSGNVFATNPQPTQLMADVRDMAMGEQQMLIVKSNGDLFAAGRNLFGQLGDGTTTDRASFVPVASNVAAVAAGQEHSAFLKLDGTLWTVGLNDRGQLGTGDKTDRTQAVQIATGVRVVFAGYRRTWFVKSDGTLWRAGATDALSGTAGDATPVQVAGNPVAMASLLSHSLYLLPDGRVLSVGDNTAGQLADGTFTSRESAAAVMPGVFAMPGVVSALTATDATLAGAVRVVWSPVLGATGYEVWRGTTNNSAQATRLAAWVGETFYYDYTASAGTSYYWVRALSPAGVGTFGASDSGSPDLSALPQITAQPQDVKSYVGLSATLAVTASGTGPLSYQWTKDGATLDGATQAQLTFASLQVANSGVYRVVVSNASGSVTSQPATLSVTVPQGVLHVSAGREHTLFLRTDGSLWGMGNSAYGQIPAAQNVFQVTTPVFIANDVVAMAAGWWHTLFVTSDGKLYAMGRNNSGQLGDGTTSNRTTPVFITNDVAAVGAGANNSYFIRKDGSLWGMGEGGWQQFGNGSLLRQLAPTKLLERAAAVAVGERHAVVLKDDGTVWTAGYFSYGALGTGNASSSVWTQIATGATAVAAGDNHTLFLKSDGSVWATGDNSFGQLGNGTTAGTGGAAGVFTPFQVTTGVGAIAAGGNTSLLTKSDGTVWAMGTNAGAYGNGTTTAALIPTQVFSSNAYSVSTSGLHSVIAASDGSLRVTGANNRGQLGNGTQTASTSYLSVATGTNVAPVAPTNLVAFGDASGAGVRVAWDASVGWRRFEVWRSTTASFADATMIVQRVSLATYLDTTAQVGTTYYYWVKAANPAGVSAASAMATSAGAPPVISQSPANQTVTIGSTATFSVIATGDAPLSYQWRKGGSAIDGANSETYSIPSAQLADAGSYDVVVSNAVGSATSSAATLTVNKLSQTISFAGLPGLTFTTAPIELNAIATSSLPVTLSVVSGPATLNGNTLTLTGAGSITLRASQAGNASYLAAADVDRTFTVTKATVNVILAALSRTYDGLPKSIAVTSEPEAAGVTVTYDGSTTAPTNAGSYAVVATIDDPRYQGTATATLTIAKASQTITFAAPAVTTFTTTPIPLSATSSSNLPVTLTVVSGPATLDGDTLTLNGAGTITLRAAQAGNDNYLAAPNIERSFTIAMSFDAWLREHFTADELLDAAISGPNADPDGDGSANLVEYALGTDPRADSSANAPQMSVTATDWTFTYTRPVDRADLTYNVECSTNLTTWSSAGVTHTLVSASGGVETWRATYPVNSAASCFLRLSVSR